MTTDGHPVDEVLRSASGLPSPTSDAVAAGKLRLQAAILAERQNPGVARRGRLHRVSRLAVAAAAFVMAVGLGISFTMLRPGPVTALGDLANVAERLESPSPAAGEYLFTATSDITLMVLPGSAVGIDRAEIAYLVPHTTQIWVTDTERIELITTGEPVFFDDEAATAYAASSLPDQDGIGRTQTVVLAATDQIFDLRPWPTDVDELDGAMRSIASSLGDSRPEDVQMLELGANLLRASAASPELRAAVIRVLERLDIEVSERSRSGGVSLAVSYTDTIERRVVIEFDEDANLVREYEMWPNGDASLGVPPGTVIAEVIHAPVRLVTDGVPGR